MPILCHRHIGKSKDPEKSVGEETLERKTIVCPFMDVGLIYTRTILLNSEK